jgi:hypothetical protein
MAIVALMQLFSGSLRTIGKAEDYSKALIFARGLLDEAYSKSSPEDISKTSEFDAKFRAEVVANPVIIEDEATLYEIRVTVSWPTSGKLELTGKRVFHEQEVQVEERVEQ